MVAMPKPERTSAQIIIEEIRRQVDLQVSAAQGLDNRAMAVFGGVAAVAAIVADRVVVADDSQKIAAGLTLAALLGALFCLLMSVVPRIGHFSNGPDVTDLGGWVGKPIERLEQALVPSFVEVRNRNEDFLKAKGRWMIGALACLIATVVGIALMVGAGAIQ